MLEKKVVELADQLEAALKGVAPEAIEAAGRAIFIAGLMNLLATALVGIALLLLGRWLWRKAQSDDVYACDEVSWYLGAATALLGGAGTWLGGWLCVQNWLAVFDQKAWLALKLLDKLGG